MEGKEGGVARMSEEVESGVVREANNCIGGDSISVSVSSLQISTCTIPTPGAEVVEESGCGIFIVSYFAEPNSNG